MSERQLLEAAARAAGIADAEWKDLDGWGEVRYGYSQAMWAQSIWEQTGSGYWNPLDDDGDVARLEAACSINVAWGPSHVAASGIARGIVELYSDHGGDRNKARRYASVRAAAAMAERGE